MEQTPKTKPIDLADLDAESTTVDTLVDALGHEAREPWTSPFAASGAKQPPPAPRKPRS